MKNLINREGQSLVGGNEICNIHYANSLDSCAKLFPSSSRVRKSIAG